MNACRSALLCARSGDAGEGRHPLRRRAHGGLSASALGRAAPAGDAGDRAGLPPRLLIADEPTTALDVTIQAQILDLLLDLRDEFGMAIMIITHNMGVIAETADRVLVMYAGRMVEEAPVARLFDKPLHPYTQGLLECVPSLDQDQERLVAIPGTLPDPARRPPGCRFAVRCRHALPECRAAMPALERFDTAHTAACIRAAEFAAS